MPRNYLVRFSLFVFAASSLLFASAGARALYDKRDNNKLPGSYRLAVPAHCIAAHKIGNLNLAVNNNGCLGTFYAAAQAIDCFTNRGVGFSCEVPKNGGVEYLFGGAFWIGAVVGRDTLVTVGHDGWQANQEFNPDPEPTGLMIKRSIIDPTDFDRYEGAISEEDYIAQYTDTTLSIAQGGHIGLDPRGHVPIGIEVIQRSYAWSYEYAEDFILFDYTIENINPRPIREVFMGVYVDADVGAGQTPSEDDLCGFIPEFLDTHLVCEFVDKANIAWIADNDGDIGSTTQAAPNVTGTRIVRTPAESLEVSFNWWIGNTSAALDFGPREQPNKGKLAEAHRDFSTGGLGTPEGDKNKYYSLRNQEFDYDQAYTAIVSTGQRLDLDTLFLPPNPANKDDFADGYDTRYLLSFGPFNIDPGEILPLSFAYVAGLDLHVDANNIDNLPGDPGAYYDGLKFKDLQINARWADWIYDNPGVDTDSDGYAGVMRLCPLDSNLTGFDTVVDTTVVPPETTYAPIYVYNVVDTTFAIGDGVPDFRGASPPPAPIIFIEPKIGEMRVRFNGYRSETTRDPFSRSFDFEGYSIYVARDDRSSSYAKIVSFDKDNYNKWTYNALTIPPVFQLRDEPFTLAELDARYNTFDDPNWSPLDFTINRPYSLPGFPDSTFYFERQGFNASDLTNPSGIRKVYTAETIPPYYLDTIGVGIVDTVFTNDLDTLAFYNPAILTPDGLPRFYEYEYTIRKLLPTVPYWISVTAFDFGSPISGLPSLETNVTQNTANAYPLETWAVVDSQDLEIIVYPNPYRFDADYRARGFEGVDTTGRRLNQTDRPDDRARLIHFANVPPKCRISIFSLDGDLVREIERDVDPINPNASHATWDLITRNTQAAVSGLYYWTVEDLNSGEVQMGKLVIIM